LIAMCWQSADFQAGRTVIKVLDQKYGDEDPKSDVHKNSNKIQLKKSLASPKKSAVVVAASAKGKVVVKAAHSQKQLAKLVPLPFNKALAAKVASDDKKVAIAEKQATQAASHLKQEADDRKHLVQRAHPVATAAASAPHPALAWRVAAAASLAATSHAAAPEPRRPRAAPRRVRRGPASLASRIQSALRTEMKRNRGDAGLAREMTKAEEHSWNHELRKWGLAS
jgi:hypothetical protein